MSKVVGKRRLVGSVLIVTCLCLASILGLFGLLTPPIRVNAQQGACPANEIFRLTLPGGVPSTVLALSGFGSAIDLDFSLYYGLYPNFTPTGQLFWNESVTDWIQSNTNYTEWTFNIKPGEVFSNGQPVTSADIIATYSSNYAFNASYDFTGAHNEVISETALNSSAVMFKLNQSDATFPITISQLVLGTGILPKNEIDQFGPTYSGLFGMPNDTGPFHIVNYTSGSTEMIMARNPYFKPQPKICEIDVNFPESISQDATYVESGQSDLAQIDYGSAASLLNNPNLHLLYEKDAALQSIAYNITVYPFNQTEFRQALEYAINDSAVAQQAFQGYAEPAYNAQGIVPPLVSSLYNPNQKQYSFSPTEAMSLLHSLGYSGGGSASTPLKYPNGTSVTLNLWTDNTFSYDELAAGAVTNSLQSIGITVNTHFVNYQTLGAIPSFAPGSMYLSQGTAPVFAVAQIDALPGWDVYTHPPLVESHWEYPPNADAEYNSNVTAMNHTTNTTLIDQYLNNIQALNAQYLPVIVPDYFGPLYGYSTQRWTNWTPFPQGWVFDNTIWDNGLFLDLTPAGTSSTATSSASTSAISTPSTTVPVSTTTTSTSSSIAYPSAGILILLATIMIISMAFLILRSSEMERGPRRTLYKT